MKTIRTMKRVLVIGVVGLSVVGCAQLRERVEREIERVDIGEVIEDAGAGAAPATEPAVVPKPVVPEPEPAPPPSPSLTPDPVAEAIRISSWGEGAAGGARLDPKAELSVRDGGATWRWVRDPGWEHYRLDSGREILATCYVAVPDGRGGWMAGKFDHWPANLVARNRHNIELKEDGTNYAKVPVPERGDTVYWFAVRGDRRWRSNLVKGRW